MFTIYERQSDDNPPGTAPDFGTLILYDLTSDGT